MVKVKADQSVPAAADAAAAGSSSEKHHAVSQSTNKKIGHPAFSLEPAALSTLSICRNKHWRFISSFHGPWLQLPHELLDSLAYGNYFSARPAIIDAAVFFDVVRIRRLIDEATNLSVRAVNGTTSSALSTNLDAGHGTRRGGRGETKLSGERRFRMRELAVKKLSEAYHLDEIAASVATMQSASSLEDVAKMVLQRTPNDPHAKYVHFFHEKIPSRALAESTSLEPLDQILQGPSSDCAVLRTRALTRIFKEDFQGAAKDLTEALNTVRRDIPQHFVALRKGDRISPGQNTWESQKLTDEQKPTGIEAQLYFQRAGVYLSSACQFVEKVLKSKPPITSETASNPSSQSPEHAASFEAYHKVKLNAKRALRDYTAFLARLEYSPGSHKDDDVPPAEEGAEQSLPRLIEAAHLDSPSSEDTHIISSSSSSTTADTTLSDKTGIQPSRIYQVSDLFSPTPPGNLPAFPMTATALVLRDTSERRRRERLAQAAEQAEVVTYHPLLTEALHGVLLCHALLQTEKKQIEKHALMVARLVALSDGFPVFVAARSASRADWADILEQMKDWLEFDQQWDNLCKPGNASKDARVKNRRTERQIKERHRHETALDGTIDDRTQTRKALHAAADALGDVSIDSPAPKATHDLKAYSLGTERADVIAKWILQAPILPDAPAKPRKGKKRVARPPLP